MRYLKYSTIFILATCRSSGYNYTDLNLMVCGDFVEKLGIYIQQCGKEYSVLILFISY